MFCGVDEGEEVQKKTFTKWINARLSAHSQPIIVDLFDDLRDGKHLLALLEILTGIPLVSTVFHTYCIFCVAGVYAFNSCEYVEMRCVSVCDL